VLLIPFFISIFPPILVFAGQDISMLVISAVLFGMVLGMQESIYRAAVADLTPLTSRGKAYGIFYTMYGLGFLISGVVYGAFFDYRVSAIVISIYAVLLQIVAISALAKVKAGIKR
jgi:MFS family permease